MDVCPAPRPFPSKTNLLTRLKRLGLPLSAVVDVGVRECTGELIHAFPKLRHHLFEPVSLFYPAIAKNYARIEHRLYPMALSDTDAQQYLVVRALNRDGVGTHSAIREAPEPVDGSYVMSCEPLQVRRFDSVDTDIPRDFLLKVDVDGADLKVLQGFGDRLAAASVVIVEMTFTTFNERARYLVGRGFQLFDLVDPVYYGDGLYQFDGVFVRADLATATVRPPITEFRRALWYPLPEGTHP